MNREQALGVLIRLQVLIQEHFGGPYTDDHREFKELVALLRRGPLQGAYFVGKLFDLEAEAVDGFSARRFARREGGLSQVKVCALVALFATRSIVEDDWPETQHPIPKLREIMPNLDSEYFT